MENFINNSSQQIKDYVLLKLISKRNFSETFLIETRTAPRFLYLMSRYPLYLFKDENIKNHFFNSIDKLSKLSKINNAELYIIRYITHFIDQSHLYLISEYKHSVLFKDLYNDLIKNRQKIPIYLNYQFQTNLCKSIISGLNWIHSHKFSHNNIQPASIWFSLENYSPYWSDLGFKIPKNPLYFSPELSAAMIEKQQNKYENMNIFNESIERQMSNDVWGLGVLIYYIITGRNLLIDDEFLTKEMTEQKIWSLIAQLRENNSLKIPKIEDFGVPPPHNLNKWRIFLFFILNPNPDKRPKIEQVMSFFNSNLI